MPIAKRAKAMGSLSKLLGIVAEQVRSSTPFNHCSPIASAQYRSSVGTDLGTVSTSTQLPSVAKRALHRVRTRSPRLQRTALSANHSVRSICAGPIQKIVCSCRTRLARLYRTRHGTGGHRDRFGLSDTIGVASGSGGSLKLFGRSTTRISSLVGTKHPAALINSQASATGQSTNVAGAALTVS